MLSKAKHLLLPFLTIIFLSSCLTIEKRKYMDGYRVEWFSKNRNVHTLNKKETEFQKDFDSVFAGEITDANNSLEKNIVIERQKPVISQFFFSSDTLPKKVDKHSKEHERREKDNAKTFFFSFVASLLIAGILLTIYFNSALWFVLFGLTALLVSLLFSAVRKSSSVEPPMKSDDKMDITKVDRKTPFIAVFGFTLGLLTAASLFFFFGIVTIFSAIIGSIFSVSAIQTIKNNRIKYDGMGFAIAGTIMNFLGMGFILVLLLFIA